MGPDSNSRIQRYVEEIESILLERYPEARFGIGTVPDDFGSIGIYTYTHADNAWDVITLVGDRLVDILVEEDIAIHVIPLHLEDVHRHVPRERSSNGTWSAGFTGKTQAAGLERLSEAAWLTKLISAVTEGDRDAVKCHLRQIREDGYNETGLYQVAKEVVAQRQRALPLP